MNQYAALQFIQVIRHTHQFKIVNTKNLVFEIGRWLTDKWNR
jgi:hypothetical protein